MTFHFKFFVFQKFNAQSSGTLSSEDAIAVALNTSQYELRDGNYKVTFPRIGSQIKENKLKPLTRKNKCGKITPTY